MREEIVSMMLVDALGRKLAFEDIKDAYKSYRTQYFRMHPDKGAPQSLDAKVFEDGEATLGDRIDSTIFRF